MMTVFPQALPEPRPPYHHGDLARALLQAAGDLIEEEGLEAFTLRACARRAGVSHAAPAHHFRDRAGLLSAYAATVFRDMTAQGEARVQAAGNNPYARLKAVGLSYIDFAIQRPGAFRLVFRCEVLDKGSAPLREAGDACFALLAEVVGSLTPPERKDQVFLYSMLAWSVVHGFAHLWLEGNFAQAFCHHSDEPDVQADILASRILDLLKPAFGKS
jgi:AcrR family transcriptional regulator